MITEALISRQTERVVRGVFRSSPGEVAVVVHREPDIWEGDQDWQWSTG